MNSIRNNNINNELDKTDEQIIRLLQKNARLSNKQIAAEVGIAESTCSERMRKLHRNILRVSCFCRFFKTWHKYRSYGCYKINQKHKR
jgi:predicted ArsR family transcriptional regulator